MVLAATRQAILSIEHREQRFLTALSGHRPLRLACFGRADGDAQTTVTDPFKIINASAAVYAANPVIRSHTYV